jgi:hypothetical protein
MTQTKSEQITAASLKLCAGRTTMTGEEFINALHELIEACAFVPPLVKVEPRPIVGTELRGPIATTPLQNRDVLPPQIKPMLNNRDLALARYRTKNPYDEPPPEPGESTPTPPSMQEPPKHSRNGKPVSDEEKDVIRQLARRARIGRVRLPHGFAATLARDYDLSESYIYNIIQTDPTR